MALPTKINNQYGWANIEENGGKGSGNFGHSGRPGEVGGSAPSGSGGNQTGKKSARKWYKEKYPGDYQADEIPDIPLAELTNKEIDFLDTQVRERLSEAISKTKTEREKHVKQIDKIIGSEKITEGKTKAEDDKNYKKLEKDIREIKKILAKEKSRENFGQEEIRKLRDKYSDYMSGNWSVTERFQRSMRDFEDWADNYQNY